MSNPQFRLRLLDQYWISGSRDPSAELDDPTSHGQIQFLVHGEDISGCAEYGTDYGINQSAVRLLQTLFADNAPAQWSLNGPFNPVFYHGCTIMGTCPTCVLDYSVRHLPEGLVFLDRFLVTGGPKEFDPLRFASRSIQIPLVAYAREVVAFAQEALSLLGGSRGDDVEKQMFEALRSEHERLLVIGQRVASGGNLTAEERASAIAFDVETCQFTERP